MKNFTRLFLSLFVVGLASCQQANNNQATSNTASSSVSGAPCNLQIDNGHCVQLAESISEMEDLVGVNITAVYNNPGVGGSVGDQNIAVEWDGSSTYKLLLIENTLVNGGNMVVRKTELADLSTQTAQVRMTANGDFAVQVYNGQKPKWRSRTQFRVGDKFDMKIIPDFRGTDSPALVGMDDARNATTTAEQGIAALIDFISWPNEKRIRFYYDGADMIFSYTGSVKFTGPRLQKFSELGEVCWKTDFSRCEP
ncbi:MAG: hypothetical protein JKX84_05815 [Flavobacteriales bacterium]|nr:hypothetical protein [Flavobacteriales bacterium]